MPKTNNSNQPSVVKGSSSSGTLRYVPVVPPPTAATTDATVTQVAVPPPTAATSNGTATQAIVPPSVATTNENATEFDVPLAIASTTNENATQSVPQRDVATGCFRYILQDVSNADPQGNLPRPDVHVLELAATVEHDDVQTSIEAATHPVTRNDDVHSVSAVSVLPIFTIEHVDDDVDNYVSQDRERSSASVLKGACNALFLLKR